MRVTALHDPRTTSPSTPSPRPFSPAISAVVVSLLATTSRAQVTRSGPAVRPYKACWLDGNEDPSAGAGKLSFEAEKRPRRLAEGPRLESDPLRLNRISL